MRKMLLAAVALCVVAPFVAVEAQAQQRLPSRASVTGFEDRTGLATSDEQVQGIWNSLQAMGTTEFLGGAIGNFKLDESSMIAGALSMGSSEFDRFLRSGSVSISGRRSSDGTVSAMSQAAGVDFSRLTGGRTADGGFTIGSGGRTTLASMGSLGGASADGGLCTQEASQALVDRSLGYVQKMTSAATDEHIGFSQITGTGGFSSMSCLDKLFTMSGADIMFTPPNLSNLTSQLQGWSCPTMESVASQVAGHMDLDQFQTASLGGFFPALTMSDASEGVANKRPGHNVDSDGVYGTNVLQVSSSRSSVAGLSGLFR